MEAIDKILSRISLEGSGNRRQALNPAQWSMETMLEAVRRIGCSFDSRFVLDNDNTEVYTNLVYWMMNDGRMQATDPRTGRKISGRLNKGIYIAGNTGSGKTMAMNILRKLYGLNRFRSSDEKPVFWSEKRADEIADHFAMNGDLEPYKKAPLLSIQDLGCEPAETLYMGNRVKVLQNIIEYRGDRRDFVTMVTSNIPMGHEDLRKRYGERATSRMMEMMNYLTLTGKDRRQNF